MIIQDSRNVIVIDIRRSDDQPSRTVSAPGAITEEGHHGFRPVTNTRGRGVLSEVACAPCGKAAPLAIIRKNVGEQHVPSLERCQESQRETSLVDAAHQNCTSQHGRKNLRRTAEPEELDVGTVGCGGGNEPVCLHRNEPSHVKATTRTPLRSILCQCLSVDLEGAKVFVNKEAGADPLSRLGFLAARRGSISVVQVFVVFRAIPYTVDVHPEEAIGVLLQHFVEEWLVTKLGLSRSFARQCWLTLAGSRLALGDLVVEVCRGEIKGTSFRCDFGGLLGGADDESRKRPHSASAGGAGGGGADMGGEPDKGVDHEAKRSEGDSAREKELLTSVSFWKGKVRELTGGDPVDAAEAKIEQYDAEAKLAKHRNDKDGEAKAEMNKAKAEMNKAEAKMNKAEAKMNKAEAKMNKAEAKMIKAKADGDEDGHARALQDHQRATKEYADAEKVHDLLLKLMEATMTVIQDGGNDFNRQKVEEIVDARVDAHLAKRATIWSPTTEAEFYNHFEKTMNCQMWFEPVSEADFPKTLFSIDLPPIGCPEEDIAAKGDASAVVGTQSRWTRRLKRFPKLLNSKPSEPLMVIHDRHTQTSIGSRKPDDIVYVNNSPCTEPNVVVIGDNKRCNAGGFTATEKGQLLHFCVTLFKFQPLRSQIPCYLNNGRMIQFFRLEGGPDGATHVHESREMSMDGDGGLYLLGLLATPPPRLGWNLPCITINGDGLRLESFLGQGGSSVVYQSSHDGVPVVAKCFRPTVAHRLAEEEKVLTVLAQKVPALCGSRVPAVVGTDTTADAIVLRPPGRAFATCCDRGTERVSMTLKHFEQLVNALQLLHTKVGYVHRDLGLHNMFDVNGDLLLNDWGCAAKIGEDTGFSGSRHHMPCELHGVAEYQPKPEHDLVMVWRCLGQSRDMARAPLYRLASDEEIRGWWKGNSTPEDIVVVAKLMSAESCKTKYQYLKDEFAKKFPSSTS